MATQSPPPDETITRLAAALDADIRELLRAAGRETSGRSFETIVLDRLGAVQRELLAGFSASHAFLGWEGLLRQVAADLRFTETEPSLTYEDIRRFGDDDFLRIAEYLFLRAGRSIGPLRYSITNALHTDLDPLTSTPHVELVNLGCPQIYTTNFDEVIEMTYRRLDQQPKWLRCRGTLHGPILTAHRSSSIMVICVT